MIGYDSHASQHEKSLLFYMSKNPEKKFEYIELLHYMDQNKKIPSPDYPTSRIMNLTRDGMMRKD